MADASEALTAFVSDDFLRSFEETYNRERETEAGPSNDTTFQYAWCLVRSRLKTDIRKGIMLLDELIKKRGAEENRRDCLYYLAVAHARNKDYTDSLKYLKVLLQNEPGNKQAQGLEREIRKAMDSDALKGAAIAGGAILGAGALIGLGMAFLKRN